MLKSQRIRKIKRRVAFPCFVEEGKILCQKAPMPLISAMVRIFLKSYSSIGVKPKPKKVIG
jgi:hypothetical protein